MATPRIDWRPYHRAHLALHHLWTKAAGGPTYVAAEWEELARYIDDLALLARGEATEEDVERLDGLRKRGT